VRRPLSIGLFTYSTRPRGSVVHSAALAEALTDLGHDVTLYALDKIPAGFYRPLRCRFVPIPTAPASSETDALIRQRIQEFVDHLTTQRPVHDVAHAEDCLATNALIRLPEALLQAPVVRTVHHVERFESPYLDRCQRRSIEEADLLLTVSRATERELAVKFQRQSHLIPNGVDAARFQVVDASRARQAYGRYGIAPDSPVILSVGGVEERKNTFGMLKAFALFHEAHPNARWVIVGGASVLDHADYQRAFTAELAASSSLRDAIVQTGVVEEDELVALYRSADALLFASLHEGFGLTALEALAAGTPVVASRIAPMTEFLSTDNAVLVDPLDPQDIARGIATALGREGRSERIQAGLRTVAQYSWRAAAEAHHNLYLKAMQA